MSSHDITVASMTKKLKSITVEFFKKPSRSPNTNWSIEPASNIFNSSQDRPDCFSSSPTPPTSHSVQIQPSRRFFGHLLHAITPPPLSEGCRVRGSRTTGGFAGVEVLSDGKSSVVLLPRAPLLRRALKSRWRSGNSKIVQLFAVGMRVISWRCSVAAGKCGWLLARC